MGVASMEDEVRAKFEEWRKRLLDFSRKNRLLYFRPTRRGTLPLEGVSADTLYDALVVQGLEIRFEGVSEADADTEETLPTVAQSRRSLVVRLDRTEDDLRKTLNNLHRRSRQSILEQGVHTLHMALGFLEWYEIEHSDEPVRSPLLLVPVELEREPGGDFVLRPTGDPLEANVVLAEKLRRDLSIKLPEWQESADADAALHSYLGEVRCATEPLARSSVHKEAVLDTFSFAKLVMYKDLEQNTERALGNELIRGICGDPPPRPEIGVPTGEELDDRLSYADCYHVLDADTSQREAIAAATEGESFILVGPPGTGKSQTIANIIAASIANGKKVLFVSEKAAALDVVYRRLEECNLHHFCLDLHSARGRRGEVLEQLGRALEFEADETAGQTDYSTVEDQRRNLNAYARALHEPFGNLGWTPFQVHGQLARLTDVPEVLWPGHKTASQTPNDVQMADVDRRTLEKMEEAMRDVEELADLFAQGKKHPWWGCKFLIKSPGDRISLRKALEDLRDVAVQAASLCDELRETWGILPPRTLDGLEACAGALQCLTEIDGCPVENAWLTEDSLDEHRRRAGEGAEQSSRLAASHDAIHARYGEDVWQLDPDGLAERFARYEKSWLRRRFTSGPDRRALCRCLRDEIERPSFAQLVEDVKHLKTCADAKRWFEQHSEENRRLFGDYYYKGSQTDWPAIAGLLDTMQRLNGLMRNVEYSSEFHQTLVDPNGTPGPSGRAADLQQRLRKKTERLRQLTEYFLCTCFNVVAVRQSVGAKGLDEIRQWAEARLASFDEVDTWQRYQRLRNKSGNLRLTRWIDHFLQTPEQAEIAEDVFRKSFCLRWLGEVYRERPALAEFSFEEFERLRREFAGRDKEVFDENASRVQWKVAQLRGNIKLDANIGQVHTLRRQLRLKRRYKPIRQLLREIPELAQKLTPCMMMSPLTVSQYLGSERLEFDLVVFDEASQVKPEDALAAIMRGSQLILSGDPNQLPPTTFFDVASDDARDDESDLQALESILDEAGVWLPERMLRWHYRSRHDELIAFSNHEFYDNLLVTFPDAGGETALGVRFVHCPEAIYDRGGSRTNAVEAEKVADLVAEVKKEHPLDSVGVVAFSQAQQDAILDVFEERAREDTLYARLLSDDDDLEPFFIKNLETVQGDERDTIIISVGYGPDADGRLTMNFGPLNQEAGARRLNVAVTRARKREILVSSMTAHDIDPSAARGAQLLRRYLDFAARGPDALGTGVSTTAASESPFEEAVGNALRDRGLQVEAQVGCGPYRIDLGIVDPERPGRYLLGVECDGATYHSCQTARDRDRLREQVLKDRGWRIVRIWSTDWWRNPQRQVDRVVQALEDTRETNPADGDEAVGKKHQLELEIVEDRNETDQDGFGRDSGEENAQVPDYGFPPYHPLALGKLGNPEAFYRMAETKARDLLEHLRLIVEAEGPVHFEVAMKRLTKAFDISRCGSRIRDLMESCVSAAERQGYCACKDKFLWRPDADDVEVRTNEGSHFQRDISEFALEEIAKAVVTVVEAAHGASEAEVISEVARALGFGRTSNDIRKRIEYATVMALNQGSIERAGAELLPAQRDIGN